MLVYIEIHISFWMSIKSKYYVSILMYNKHTVASYAAIISSILVASVLAVGFVQHVVAQDNNTSGSSGGASSNMTGGNMTSGSASSNSSSIGSSGSSK
jgi:hypothetical protein